MKINFTKNSTSGVHEVHLLYKVNDEIQLSKSAIVSDRFNVILDKTGDHHKFKGNFLDSFFITHNNHDALFISIGDPDKLDENKLEKVGGAIYSKLQERGTQGKVQILVDDDIKISVTNIAFGMQLKEYKFDKYFTKKDKEETNFEIDIVQDTDLTKVQEEYKNKDAMIQGISFAKDLISEPSNVLYPQSYADRVLAMGVDTGLNIKVYGEHELREMGAGALLAVGQGSARESKMVVMGWMNGNKEDPTMAFVGKGVCFDTGGYSIKPSKGLKDMKYDMGGSAVVVGTMMSLALRKAKVNAVGVIGLVENMVSSTAYKPGDVITSMSGQTIEIDNTDAEGRVVLADALWYTQKTYNPKTMINLATLTGAVSIALGDQLAGLFSNNDEISNQLIEAGKQVDEEVWRLPCDPIGERYDKYVDSTIADMHNVGKGYEASSSTAAQFLQRFVNDVPWAHLDIAGVTWNDKGSMTAKGGATGWGVKLLNKWVDNVQ